MLKTNNQIGNIEAIFGHPFTLADVPDPPEVLPVKEQLQQRMCEERIEPPNEIVINGKIQRFNILGHKNKNNMNGWYVIFNNGPVPAGCFMDFSQGEKHSFRADIGRKLTQEEEAAAKECQKQAKLNLERQEAEKHKKAAKEAQRIWSESEDYKEEANHPYLRNKQVASHGLKVNQKGFLILPLYDDNGMISSLQYIWDTGEKRYLSGSRKQGCYWWIGELGNAQKAFMAEGYATAASIYEATGLPVIIAFDSGNLVPVSKVIKQKHPKMELVIVADNDASRAGEKAAQAAAEASGARVILIPEPGDANDYAAAGKDLKGLLLGEEELEPLVISGRIHPGRFDVNLLPKVLKDYVADEAERMGADPGMLAMFALSAVATVLDHRLKIQVKKYDPGWTQAPRLWIAVVAPPSTKKSPALQVAFKPVRGIEAEEARKYQKALKEWQEATAEMKKGEIRTPEPVHKRLTVSDATVEKIGDILGKLEPRGITSIHDELSGWLAGMDAYRGKGIQKDRAAWLTAYTGGSWSIDRINRGSVFVENWSISVVGGIQPEVLFTLMKSYDHDGMLPRFLLYYAESASIGEDRAPDYEAKQNYTDLLKHLYGIQPGNSVIISEAGHTIREKFFIELKKAAELNENRFLQAAYDKADGIWARLVLVFHCIEAAEKHIHPETFEASAETAERAVNIMRLLMRHAIKFYSDIDPDGDLAQGLGNLILAKGWSRFTVKRDLQQHWKPSRNLKPWEIYRVLDRLEAFAWIVPEEVKLNEHGRPVAYKVNPKVHVMFDEQAKKERERRAEQYEFMKGLKA
jgi:phage/plasmid primase-like uncharacterized protein